MLVLIYTIMVRIVAVQNNITMFVLLEKIRTAGVAEVQNILYSIIPTYGPVGIVITNMASWEKPTQINRGFHNQNVIILIIKFYKNVSLTNKSLFIQVLWWHIFAPISKIHYINMQNNYINIHFLNIRLKCTLTIFG